MIKYRFTPKAFKEFKKLDLDIKRKILSKLDYFCSTDTPTVFSKHLSDSIMGEYRFRIGDYRIIFDADGDGIRILKIGHRREIYK